MTINCPKMVKFVDSLTLYLSLAVVLIVALIARSNGSAVGSSTSTATSSVNESTHHSVLLDESHSLIELVDFNANNEFNFSWNYLKSDNLTRLFKKLESQYSNLATLVSVGKSVENKDIWALKISTDVGSTKLNERKLLKPMFKYVGNMHGNEAISRQILIYFAQFLLGSYGKDDRVTRIVNSTEIHIIPSMNPDGFEVAREGDCYGKGRKTGRENANAIDLNRNFPDQFSRNVEQLMSGSVGDKEMKELIKGREPETIAMMTYIVTNPFVLSANLHGGSVVASYPFDDSSSHVVEGTKSPSPDDKVFMHLAQTYSSSHLTMKKGRNCEDDHFKDGITNGAEWYDVPGGMQDFNYVFSNCFEITVELSCCKYPNATNLQSEWFKNKEALLSFVEQVHLGIKGIVRDSATNKSIQGADIEVDGIGHNVTSTYKGEYWRLLMPGEYKVSVHAYGYQTLTKSVTVKENNKISAVELDFDLISSNSKPEPYQQKPGTVEIKYVPRPEEGPIKPNSSQLPGELGEDFVTQPEFRHHNYKEMTEFMEKWHKKYPHISRLYTIGKSVQGRDLMVMEISDNPGIHEPGEPEFKYVSNIHGNEVVGRELLLLLMQRILEGYDRDKRVGWLVNETRIHIMPSMNPDGYEMANLGDCDTEIGRNNARKVDLNRNFPDQFEVNSKNRVQQPETSAVMNWIASYPFVLSASLHGGSLVANYPYDGNKEGRDSYSKSPDDITFKMLASSYAKNHKTMFKGKPCNSECGSGIMNEFFADGITNGANWYQLYGGMQDYNYLHSNCFEVTIELGCYKYPYASDLPKYWSDNRLSLMTYIQEVHQGVKGFIIDTNNNTIENATIHVEGIRHDVISARDGDYWRILVPGRHTLVVNKEGYRNVTQIVEVPLGPAIKKNFTLEKISTHYDPKEIEREMSAAVKKSGVVTPPQLGDIDDIDAATNIAGVPRPVFIIIGGSILLSAMVSVLCVYSVVARRRYNDRYKFHLITESTNLFNDEEGLLKSKKKFTDHRVDHFVDDLSSSSEDELYNVKVWNGNKNHHA